ncbi:ABC transporter permease subunit [Woodsholea maritima]|uniref:ABC transporter permease subunit n=1 Tax=Woodsholea maritima TaxID=240237 RepID=UPI000375506E|nr:DUF3526 domain-containing protein [Woodsholea maritima]
MITAIITKELREFSRDRRFLTLAVLLLMLMFAASVDGWNRARSDDHARQFAEHSDHHIWVEQGENNPHGAAHFARYAFRPTPALSAFDPGVFDFAGAAFWMEAHTQNPTSLRRVEDVAISTPFAALSPAWIIQVVGSLALAVLLFQTLAGERERGTLRALAAIGIPATQVVAGKAGSVLSLVTLLSLIIFLIALGPSLLSPGLDVCGLRVLTLIGVYLIGLCAFAFVIVAISAVLRTSASAFTAAISFWVASAIIIPILGGQLAASLHPDMDEQALKNTIQLEAQSPFWTGDARGPAVAALEEKVLEEFGAERFEDLGFDREALILQAHEEFANAVYDRLYGALYDTHQAQDQVLRYLSLASPLLAVQRVSAALSETDQSAQIRFAQQSEAHRRTIIEMLNRNMMIHAGDQGFSYSAGRDLWESIPDFVNVRPSTLDILTTMRVELISLGIWLLLSILLALGLVRRALLREAQP